MVYLIQEDITKDLSPARAFGEIVTLFPTGEQLIKPKPHIYEALNQKLGDFDPETDYLLLIGDPVMIGIVSAMIDRVTRGNFNVLKWDRINREYTPIEIRIP